MGSAKCRISGCPKLDGGFMAIRFYSICKKYFIAPIAAIIVTVIAFNVRSAPAQTTPFYKDKTIRIIVGFTSGGLYDQYARLLARYMGKHLPGNPTIIVQNMPGAGSLIATNYVSNV